MIRRHAILVKKNLLLILLLPVLIILTSFGIYKNADPLNLISLLKNQSRKIKNLEVCILTKERINGEYISKKNDFKINTSPFKLYLKEEYPRKGLEVLYVDGLNNGKAWVRPNSFPWSTISLSPLGNTMRNGQHHSIFKSGYSFFIDVLDHMQTKYNDNLNDLISYNARVKYNNIICHKITFTNPNFKYVYYTIIEGDNLEKLSYKLKVNDYMIKEINPEITSFEKLETGKKIKVPNDYGTSFILYIEEQSNLLIGVKIFDDKGLWEEYTYSNIKINPSFDPADFDVKNPEYNF